MSEFDAPAPQGDQRTLTRIAVPAGAVALAPLPEPAVAPPPVSPASRPAPSVPTVRTRRPGDAVKRALDIVVAAVALLLALPLMILVALVVRLESPGPVIFRQRRLGRDREPFTMLKFRTMRPDAEQTLQHDAELNAEFQRNGCKLPKGGDPRITRIGALLRSTSLDELPQLLNVLRGTMSLVGPRPPIVEQIPELFGPDQDLYFSVRPGLSGAWQVNGRSDLTPEERRDIDVEYVVTRSLHGDLWILAATIPAVLSRRGAY